MGEHNVQGLFLFMDRSMIFGKTALGHWNQSASQRGRGFLYGDEGERVTKRTNNLWNKFRGHL